MLDDRLCNIPTMIQIQFVTCFPFFTWTNALNFAFKWLYNSWLLLIIGLLWSFGNNQIMPYLVSSSLLLSLCKVISRGAWKSCPQTGSVPDRTSGTIQTMKRWQFWVGAAISILFLGWALHGQNLGNLWQAIRHADYWWIIPGVAVYFIAVWARAWRWHYLLRPIKAIPTRIMFPITCIG